MAKSCVSLVRECQRKGIFPEGQLSADLTAEEYRQNVMTLARNVPNKAGESSLTKRLLVVALLDLAGRKGARPQLRGLMQRYKLA